MAMDQQETFNWLVAEKSRLEKERDEWIAKAFDFAMRLAKDNPSLKAQIERERKAEIVKPETLNFVLA